MSSITLSDDELIAAFEADNEEALDAALEDMLSESSAGAAQAKDSLRNKLALFPSGDFPVSEYSNFCDQEWILDKPKHDFALKVKLDREIPGSNFLKSCLLYYLIPNFSFQSNVKSYRTTKSRGYEYSAIDDFLFKPNHLTATPADLALISIPMLNRALDAAKNSETPRKYVSLFFFIRLWSALSIQKLIPDEICLNLDLRNVDTTERHRDVREIFTGVMQGWVPYSENELEHLINYALFWTEEAMPHLQAARNYIRENEFDEIAGYTILRHQELPDFEKFFNIEVNGTRILNYNVVHRTITKGKYSWPGHAYTWVQHYATALDRVRNGIFILIALITGARKSELAPLTLDDIWKDEAGEYWIRIKRYKTANDPAHNGEVDDLPLPQFIGEKVEAFKELRDVGPFRKREILFQANQSVKPLNQVTPAILNGIINQLKDEVPVERIHCHRFRKTIAEILINRDERNIELIRMLFGHHSYEMTLRYISRNPHLVMGVAQALEDSFASEFHEIVSSVRDGSYSGAPAERIAEQIATRPNEFTGKRLRVSIMVYISHLLVAGEPVYISRTAIGTFCVSGEYFSADNPPPCLEGRPNSDGHLMPDPQNCQIDCRNAVVLAKARQAIVDNIEFFTSVLADNIDTISKKAELQIRRKIEAHQRHLNNLERNQHSPGLIPLRAIA